jgi:hypothetical protein
MPRRPLLLLGLLLAAFASGCGSDNPSLIPQTRATALSDTVDQIGQACDDHDVTKARAALVTANQQVNELPRRVDADLKDNLRDWLTYMQGRVSRDCKEEKTPTPTPSPSETPTPTPTPSETPTPTPTPTPTASATPAPSVTVEPPGNGGVPAPEG